MHIVRIRYESSQRGPQAGKPESRSERLGLGLRTISPRSFSAFNSSQDCVGEVQYLGSLWGTQYLPAAFRAKSIGQEG